MPGWIKTFLNRFRGKSMCDEDPTKVCPYHSSITVTGPGVLSCSSETLFKCCKTKKQLEALKRIHDRRNNK